MGLLVMCDWQVIEGGSFLLIRTKLGNRWPIFVLCCSRHRQCRHTPVTRDISAVLDVRPVTARSWLIRSAIRKTHFKVAVLLSSCFLCRHRLFLPSVQFKYFELWVTGLRNMPAASVLLLGSLEDVMSTLSMGLYSDQMTFACVQHRFRWILACCIRW